MKKIKQHYRKILKSVNTNSSGTVLTNIIKLRKTFKNDPEALKEIKKLEEEYKASEDIIIQL